MRLLGITLICIASACMPAHAQREKDPLCESIATPDLLICASDRLINADKKLNFAYKEQISASGVGQSGFRGVQRSWIRFRDSHCESIRNEAEGGNEADIEMTFCLAALTEDRTREIKSAGSSASDSEFLRAIRSLERAGYDRQELLDRLASTPNDDLWSDYTNKNCAYIGKSSTPDVITCKARLNFERSY